MKNIILNGVENPYYYITRDGEVYNKEGKQLTLFKMNNGYLRVKLSRGLRNHAGGYFWRYTESRV